MSLNKFTFSMVPKVHSETEDSFFDVLLNNLNAVNAPAHDHGDVNDIDSFAEGWNAAVKYCTEHSTPMRLPMPINVIFHDPATIVYWDDGSKTVVKCQPGDTFSAEVGLTTAMLKRYMGNNGTFNDVINEWVDHDGHSRKGSDRNE